MKNGENDLSCFMILWVQSAFDSCKMGRVDLHYCSSSSLFWTALLFKRGTEIYSSPSDLTGSNISFGKRQFLIPSFSDFEDFVSWCPSWDFIVLSVFGTVVSPVLTLCCNKITLLYVMDQSSFVKLALLFLLKRGLPGRQMLGQFFL